MLIRTLSLAVILVTLSCAERDTQSHTSATTQSPATPTTPVTLTLSLESAIRNRLLTVRGSTDLPDETFISYEVRHEGAATRTDVAVENMFAEGHAKVHGGNYAAEVDLSRWPRGELEVWAAFQTVLSGKLKQPDAVLSRFGDLGQNLTGANVSAAGELKRVALAEKLRLR